MQFLRFHHPMQFLRFKNSKAVSGKELKLRAEVVAEFKTTTFEFFVAVLKLSADVVTELVQFSTAFAAPTTADS